MRAALRRSARLARAPCRPLSSASSPQLSELARADVLADEGRYDEALDELRRAGDIVLALPDGHPLKATVREREARVQHRAGDYTREANAWTSIVKAHELGYAHLDALSPLVLSLLRLGEHKAAMNVAAGGMAASHKQGDQLGVSTCAFLSAYALHLQRSDIAAEVLESSLEAAREATPRSAAVGDMLKCAGVHLELVGGDAAGGRERLTSAVRFFEKHHGGAPEEAAKALVHLGALEGRAGDREASEAHFSRALALLGGVYGDAHPRLSRALRPLARAYRGFGEPVLAEGLYRSSVDNLKAAAEHTPGCDTAQAAVELAGNLREFAALMDGLEWNGRARTAEADELRAEADAVLARFPRLPPPDSESLWDESLCERYDQPFK